MKDRRCLAEERTKESYFKIKVRSVALEASVARMRSDIFEVSDKFEAPLAMVGEGFANYNMILSDVTFDGMAEWLRVHP